MATETQVGPMAAKATPDLTLDVKLTVSELDALEYAVWRVGEFNGVDISPSRRAGMATARQKLLHALGRR